MNNHAATALQRRHEIASLVRERAVRSQDELQRLLAARGIVVTQPTLSRDLKDLAVVKSPAGYALASAPGASAAESASARLARLLKEFALSVAPAGTLVVVKTPPGAANAVALAADQAAVPGVVGTIAGDDTIFLAARSAPAAARLARSLEQSMSPFRRPRG
ncbi:MAG TPA: arginine repressor [Thermoanaerobaculia bacterium]|nr:arginine repressor [Thermoanaerobaculia bacterium]